MFLVLECLRTGDEGKRDEVMHQWVVRRWVMCSDARGWSYVRANGQADRGRVETDEHELPPFFVVKLASFMA